MSRRPSVPELLTARLRLRGWKDGDVAPMSAINADRRVGRWLGGTRTPEQTAHSIREYVEHWASRGFGLWALEERATGRFVGRIGLMHWDDWPAGAHDAEVGWTLAPDFWGRGYATEGGAAALRFGFEERRMRRIISITLPDNVRSRAVMERLGLTMRGEARWRGFDQVWYAIDRADWRAAAEDGAGPA